MIVIRLDGEPKGKGRPRSQKASDEQLIEAYRNLQNVHKVGALFGMHGASAHERLVKLNVVTPMNKFSEAEIERLKLEYWIAAETGKLKELAEDMGRTKQFLCRQARELGLTDRSRRKIYASKWKYVSEESASLIFEEFKKSSLGLIQYCTKKGWDDLGFSTCMKKYFYDEWEHVIESKAPRQSLYRYGRQFEYRVRDDLKARGYFAMRSPASKTPIDIIAVKAGVVLMVQCKRHGVLGPREWNQLFDLATPVGAIPVLASSKTGRGEHYQRMTARKAGQHRQPLEDYEP